LSKLLSAPVRGHPGDAGVQQLHESRQRHRYCGQPTAGGDGPTRSGWARLGVVAARADMALIARL
jgi:hypothetical protein